MRHARHALLRSRGFRLGMIALLAVVALCWAFQWNWCRPLIRHYVMSHSGRSIEFDDLHVRFEHGLDPTIELRGLTIQNAPWAASRAPFIHAGHLTANLSWRSLGSDLIIVNLVELEDAQLDMERQADGLRNWRLVHPDDRGPAHVRVLAVDASRSQLHAIHGGLGLEADVATTPLAAAEPFPGHPDQPLTKRLVFKGTMRGEPFDGDTRVSDVIALGDTSQKFTLRGIAHVGALRVEASGFTNDAHALGDLDCDIRVSTEGTSTHWPLPEALARVRPLVAQGHVTKSGDTWTASDVHLRAGRQTALVADLTFTGNTKSDTPRRTLRATLRDAVLDVDDLSLLRGKTPPGEPTRPGTRPDADHTVSSQPLALDRLREFDADVDLRSARFTGSERGMAQTLRAHASLAGGVLRVHTLDVGLAGGHITGTLQLDASHTPADLALDISARGLRVEQLSATLAGDSALMGAIDGRAVVKSRGESSRALIAGANGSLTLALAEGATVSKRLDAKLGLNGGEWLRTLFDKSARVPVQCGAVTLALEHGVATTRRFVFETADTALAGRGSLDLAAQTLEATLTPAHKKLALLALDKAIHVQGSWHDVKVSLAPPSDDAPARCASAP
jgi:hypothetical protein